MTEADDKKLQEEIAALGDLNRAGTLDANTYFKMLVGIAYQYAKLDAHVKAAAVMQGVPLDYFREVQRRHMAEDAEYASQAYELALSLVQNGLVHLGPKPRANMPVASA